MDIKFRTYNQVNISKSALLHVVRDASEKVLQKRKRLSGYSILKNVLKKN